MSKQGKTILLIEDDVSERKAWERLFALNGFDLHTAKDSVIALDVLKILKPDLILLDWSIPPLGRDGGLRLLEKIKKKNNIKNIPIIILTGIKIIETMIKDTAEHTNVVGYFEKPIDNERLLDKVREILGNNTDSDEISSAEALIEL